MTVPEAKVPVTSSETSCPRLAITEKARSEQNRRAALLTAFKVHMHALLSSSTDGG